jgi:hypothetical protein
MEEKLEPLTLTMDKNAALNYCFIKEFQSGAKTESLTKDSLKKFHPI